RVTCCPDAGECVSGGPPCQGAATSSGPCSATTATAHPDTDATPHRTPPAHPARPSPSRPSAQTTAPRHPGPTLPSRTPPGCGSPGRCRTRPAHLCRTAPILPTSAGFSRPDLLALLLILLRGHDLIGDLLAVHPVERRVRAHHLDVRPRPALRRPAA